MNGTGNVQTMWCHCKYMHYITTYKCIALAFYRLGSCIADFVDLIQDCLMTCANLSHSKNGGTVEARKFQLEGDYQIV